MKIISWIIFCLFSLQLLTHPLFAEEVSRFYLIAANDPSLKPEAEEENQKNKKTKDEEFSDRSERAGKFLFSDIPHHLAYDLKEAFWGWGALAFGVGIGGTAILHTQDRPIQNSFQPNQLFGYNTNKVIGYVGAPYTMAGVSVLTTLVGTGMHNVKLRTTGESLMESLFWTELFTLGLKYAFDRNRPDGSRRGFPSAHSSGVFSTATVLQMMYGYKIGIPMYAFATLVAVSRVDSYNHFPSDVLMGAVLGSVIAYGTARFHKKLYKNFKITPTIGENQYGFSLTHDF